MSEHLPLDDRALDRLLDGSSRTFALALPLLRQPLRLEASTAYLLFRVADTLEDASAWDAPARGEALLSLQEFLDSPDGTRDTSRAARLAAAARLTAGWLARPPCEEAGYLELLGRFPELVATLETLHPAPRALILRGARRTISGMRRFLARGSPGALALESLEDLRGYCYVVAGMVGELLTELLLHAAPGHGARAARSLRARAALFGEALQLVNVLRDEAADRSAGRWLLPRGERERVIALAREDLRRASEYVGLLAAEAAGVDDPAARTQFQGYLAFASFLVRLAGGTLDRVAHEGPGAKLSRAEVARLAAQPAAAPA